MNNLEILHKLVFCIYDETVQLPNLANRIMETHSKIGEKLQIDEKIPRLITLVDKCARIGVLLKTHWNPLNEGVLVN